MIKKVLISFIVILFVVIIPIIYPAIVKGIGTLHSVPSYITVTEINGKDTITMDSMKIGETPLLNYPISAGSHTIEIIKKTTSAKYFSLVKSLYFESNTNNVITTELGPNETYSFYHILTFQKSPSQTGIYITADQYQSSDTALTLNNKVVQNKTVLNENPGIVKLVYNKTGYTGIQNDITIHTGYILLDTIHLFKNPI